MIARPAFAAAAFALLCAIGCADVLGFEQFTEVPADGGAPAGLADGGAASSDGGFDANGSHPEAGPSTVPCSPACGAGDTCQNGSCVCDPLTCTGCCTDTTCSVSYPTCGVGGGACNSCDVHSDHCGDGGTCACGSGAACGVGSICTNAACVCDPKTCAGTCCGDACVTLATDGSNCGVCGHSCLGAECSGGECVPTTLATAGTTGYGITLSPTTAYWITPVGIYSCALAGCGANVAGPFTLPGYVFDETDAIEYADAGPLVFASSGNASGDEVFSIAPDGGDPRTVQAVAGGWTIQIDQQSPFLYWATGTEVERQAVGVGPIGVVMSNLTSTPVVAGDATNIYAADTTELLACPLASGECGANATVIAEVPAIALIATEPDAANVYFATTGALYRCPSTGCPSPTSVTPWVTAAGEVRAIVTDATNVYWTDVVSGDILKCAQGTSCPSPTTIASNVGAPWGIAVDDTYVYWTLADGPIAVQRAPK